MLNNRALWQWGELTVAKDGQSRQTNATIARFDSPWIDWQWCLGWRWLWRGSGGGVASARTPARCGSKLGNGRLYELEWGLERSLRVWDSYGSKRTRDFTGCDGNGGRRGRCFRAWRKGEGFYSSQASGEEVSSCLCQRSGDGMASEVVGDVQQRGANGGRVGGRPACARASRGTNQQLCVRQHTVIRVLRTDQRSLLCLGVRVLTYGGGADVARGDVMH
jgi:hypothetical protein